MNTFTTIYVHLLNEGVDVWRPVRAENVGNQLYRIPSSETVPDDEKWEFGPGTLVRCTKKQFSGGNIDLVAFEKAE